MRAIDSKFYVERDEIKGPNGATIPEDEPLFLIRARDYLALTLLREYEQLCAEDGCTDYQMEGIRSAIVSFEKFADDHAERMKQPGVTKGL